MHLTRRLGTLLVAVILPLTLTSVADTAAASMGPDDACRVLALRLEGVGGVLGGLGRTLSPVCGVIGDLPGTTAARPTLDELVGQKLMVRMGGTRPSARLLE